jgi:hypothetical protein
MLGSDDEAAICQCFSHFFPAAVTVVCSRHLGVNIIRQLDEVLERSYAVGCDILQGLFGQEELRDCCDVVSIDEVAISYVKAFLLPLLHSSSSISNAG